MNRFRLLTLLLILTSLVGFEVKPAQAHALLVSSIPKANAMLASSPSQIELYFSHQATQLKTDSGPFTGSPLFDLDIDYYHLGGTYGVDEGKVRPFVVGTVGVTHMVPQGPGLDALTKFSLSLGVGVKLFATDRVGLRLEGRWFGTLFNGSGSAFCTSGACAINVQGDLFSQFVANAGIFISF